MYFLIWVCTFILFSRKIQVYDYSGMYDYFFFCHKYLCTILLCMVIFFWQKVQVYDYFFPNFPPCTIKKVCKVIVFFLIFHYVRLSKCYVRLFFLPRFPLCTVIWVCTFIFFPQCPLCTVIRVCMIIVFSLTVHYVRLFGYVLIFGT